MFGNVALEIFGKAITALKDDLSKEKSKIGTVFKQIYGYPIKIIATYIFAPFLMIRMACVVKSLLRRIIAIIGLLLSLVASYGAATFLGTLAGAALVASKIGWLVGAGFFIGTTFSVVLSVIFSIIVFNSVSFLFLKLNSQEVIDYLNTVAS